MPNMAKMTYDPGFVAKTPEDEEAVTVAKKQGIIEVAYDVAIENIRVSNGLYRIMHDTLPEASVAPASLDSMTVDQLKLLAAGQGIVLEGKIKKADLLALIAAKLAAVEVE